MAFVCVPKDWATVEPRRRWQSPCGRFVLYRSEGSGGRWMLCDLQTWAGSAEVVSGRVSVYQLTRGYDRLLDALKAYQRGQADGPGATEAEERERWERIAGGGAYMTPAFRALTGIAQ